jgi:hypothetical protein
MATFTAGPNGIDMNTLALPNSVLSDQITPTQITTQLQNGAIEYYDGSFFAPSGSLNSGTATSYQRVFTNNGGGTGGGDPYGYGGYNPGVTTTVFSITGANVSATQINQDLTASNSTPLLQSFLTGHDTYVGSSATDVLIGQGGNDTFQGGSGTETFIPAAGSNTIVGGSGLDTVQFKGPASAYTIVSNHDGSVTVNDSVASRNGSDHISNVQFLQFTDRMQIVANGTEAQIALLYQGALGRIPDAPGLTGWEQAFAAEPASAQSADNFTALAGTPVNNLPDLAYGFTQSTEFQQKYGTLTNTQFVTQLYANVLDRAPDQAGLNGWVNALASGHTREWVLVGFAESPEAFQNAEVGFVGQSGSHPGWLTIL